MDFGPQFIHLFLLFQTGFGLEIISHHFGICLPCIYLVLFGINLLFVEVVWRVSDELLPRLFGDCDVASCAPIRRGIDLSWSVSIQCLDSLLDLVLGGILWPPH